MYLDRASSERSLSCYCVLLGTCLLLSTLSTALAQGSGVESGGTGGRHVIRGRVVFPSGQRADLRLKIRLESSGYGELSVLCDSNGNFSFQSLTPGTYTVVVEGGEFYETARESVFVETASVATRRAVGVLPLSRPFTVQIYLKPKVEAGKGKSGVLNAALSEIPKAAAALYLEAMEFAAKGQTDKAIAELKQSLAIFPGFGLALNELGVQYMILKQLDKATEAFRSAVNLSPDQLQPRLNYGIALLNQMKFHDAETELRHAIKISDSASTAHMYLGITLVSLKRYDEAEKELGKSIVLAGGKLAQSHYYLGGIYWKAGDFKRAAEELEKYLQLDPKAANAEKIRATIKDLRSKS